MSSSCSSSPSCRKWEEERVCSPSERKRRDTLRHRFVQQVKHYLGVPYKRKYHSPDSPHYHSPLFLDCCGLIRRALRDLEYDFGFRIGRWNQSYQFDTLPLRAASVDKLKPGDLIFYRADFFEPEKHRKQVHKMVHVEMFVGGKSGRGTIGARWATGVVSYFDDYEFESKKYGNVVHFFASIESWLAGVCESFCTQHKWRRKDQIYFRGKPLSELYKSTSYRMPRSLSFSSDSSSSSRNGIPKKRVRNLVRRLSERSIRDSENSPSINTKSLNRDRKIQGKERHISPSRAVQRPLQNDCVNSHMRSEYCCGDENFDGPCLAATFSLPILSHNAEKGWLKREVDREHLNRECEYLDRGRRLIANSSLSNFPGTESSTTRSSYSDFLSSLEIFQSSSDRYLDGYDSASSSSGCSSFSGYSASHNVDADDHRLTGRHQVLINDAPLPSRQYHRGFSDENASDTISSMSCASSSSNLDTEITEDEFSSENTREGGGYFPSIFRRSQSTTRFENGGEARIQKRGSLSSTASTQSKSLRRVLNPQANFTHILSRVHETGPASDFHREVQREKTRCLSRLVSQAANSSSLPPNRSLAYSKKSS